MSEQAPNWYQQQWKAGANHVYQAEGFELRNTTEQPVKIVGDTMYFMFAGKGEAEMDVQRGDEAINMNAGRSKVAVTTKKSRAFDEVYEDDLDQMTVDENQVVRETSAMALGRGHTKTIYTELKGTGSAAVGSYANIITPLELIKARQAMLADSVRAGKNELFVALDSVSWSNLMSFDVISNSDYVGPNLPFVDGSLARSWDGFHMFQLDDGLLGIDPANPTQVDCMMWHKKAVGFGTTRDMTGNVSWDNRKDCWTHNMRMRYGCKRLQDAGIRKIKGKYDPASIALN